MRNIIELNSFSAVAAGQTANLVLQPGVTYDAIYLQSADNDDIESITMKLNGEDILPALTVAEIEGIQYRKSPQPAVQEGVVVELPIQLRDALYDGTQRTTGLVVGPGDNCVIDVKLKSDADAPTLSAIAETRGFPGKRAVVRKFERVTIPASSAGKVDFTSIQRGSRLLRAYFAGDQAINGLEIIRDTVKVFEITAAMNNFVNENYGADSAVDAAAGFTMVFDPVREGFPLKDAMSTQSNFLNFKIDVAGAGNVTCLLERLEPSAVSWTTSAVTAAKSARKIGRT